MAAGLIGSFDDDGTRRDKLNEDRDYAEECKRWLMHVCSVTCPPASTTAVSAVSDCCSRTSSLSGRGTGNSFYQLIHSDSVRRCLRLV